MTGVRRSVQMSSDRRKWVVLSVLIISLFSIVLDNTVLNVALKTIADPTVGLGATQSQLEWAINSYTLVFAGLLFTFGVIGDRVGRKRMLIIGMALFGLASLISSYAQTPAELIWARAAMGLGGAAVMPQTLSIITNVFDPKERPKAIGISASAVGAVIGCGGDRAELLRDVWRVLLHELLPAERARLQPDARRPAHDAGGTRPAGRVEPQREPGQAVRGQIGRRGWTRRGDRRRDRLPRPDDNDADWGA